MFGDNKDTVKIPAPPFFNEELLLQNKTTVHKMVFVYNALLSGWTVTLGAGGEFVFTDPRGEGLTDTSCLTDFVLANLTAENVASRDVPVTAE